MREVEATAPRVIATTCELRVPLIKGSLRTMVNNSEVAIGITNHAVMERRTRTGMATTSELTTLRAPLLTPGGLGRARRLMGTDRGIQLLLLGGRALYQVVVVRGLCVLARAPSGCRLCRVPRDAPPGVVALSMSVIPLRVTASSSGSAHATIITENPRHVSMFRNSATCRAPDIVRDEKTPNRCRGDHRAKEDRATHERRARSGCCPTHGHRRVHRLV